MATVVATLATTFVVGRAAVLLHAVAVAAIATPTATASATASATPSTPFTAAVRTIAARATRAVGQGIAPRTSTLYAIPDVIRDLTTTTFKTTSRWVLTSRVAAAT